MTRWNHALFHGGRAITAAAISPEPVPDRLRRCPDCAREVERTRSLLAAARAFALARTAEPEEARFLSSLRERIAAASSPARPPAQAAPRLLTLALATAAVLMAVAGVRLTRHGGPPAASPPTVEDMAAGSVEDAAYVDADLEAILGDPALARDLHEG